MLWEKTKEHLTSWGLINGLWPKKIGNNYLKRKIECQAEETAYAKK